MYKKKETKPKKYEPFVNKTSLFVCRKSFILYLSILVWMLQIITKGIVQPTNTHRLIRFEGPHNVHRQTDRQTDNRYGEVIVSLYRYRFGYKFPLSYTISVYVVWNPFHWIDYKYWCTFTFDMMIWTRPPRIFSEYTSETFTTKPRANCCYWCNRKSLSTQVEFGSLFFVMIIGRISEMKSVIVYFDL